VRHYDRVIAQDVELDQPGHGSFTRGRPKAGSSAPPTPRKNRARIIAVRRRAGPSDE
jgi:hypothetical protein